MNNKTQAMNSAIFNVLIQLAETNKEELVTAFQNSMGHMDCGHEVCENIGKDIADLIDNEDWQELSNFLDHGHLEYYN